MEEGRSCPLPSPPPLNPFPFQPLLGVFSHSLRHACPPLDLRVSQELSRCDDQQRHSLPHPLPHPHRTPAHTLSPFPVPGCSEASLTTKSKWHCSFCERNISLPRDQQQSQASKNKNYSKERKELVCLLQRAFKCITPAELLHPDAVWAFACVCVRVCLCGKPGMFPASLV